MNASRPPLPPTEADAERWIASPCAVCGARGGEVLFTVPRPADPGSAAIVRCTDCGLRRLDPRPADEILSELYPDDYYSYIGRQRSPRKQAIWDTMRDVASGARSAPPGVRHVIRRLARWQFDINVQIDPKAPLSVVDIGCGYGDLLLYLQSRGCTALGVELDQRAVDAGRALGVRIEAIPVDELSLPAASVDVVVLQHALEHIPEPARTIAEIARITRPGGELLVAVPNGGSAGLRHERDRWGALSFPQHFWFFDRDSLSELLRDHGFSVRERRSRTIAINHWRLLRHLQTQETPSAGRRAGIRAVVRTIATTWRPLRGDTLRIVATRNADDGSAPDRLGPA